MHNPALMKQTASRRRAVRSILAERVVTSQSELARLLVERGFSATQATVSRDLRAVGAVKARGSDGTLRYIRESGPSSRGTRDALATVLAGYAESVRPGGEVVVVRTPPGAAHVVAAAIDRADLPGVLGTVAGDDTILVVGERHTEGRAIVEMLEVGVE